MGFKLFSTHTLHFIIPSFKRYLVILQSSAIEQSFSTCIKASLINACISKPHLKLTFEIIKNRQKVNRYLKMLVFILK